MQRNRMAMRIKCTNTATRSLHDDDYMDDDYVVDFDEDHDDFRVANVKRDVGEALVQTDEYPDIENYEEE